MIRKFASSVAAIAFVLNGTAASANNDVFGAIVGGMIGAAIANGGQQSTTTRRSGGSGVSSAQREENKRIQMALNYFGYPAGTPDGVLGNMSRSAISSYQACLGYPITGQLSPFEKDFLLTSYGRGQAGGQQTLIAVSRMPNGYCGLLQAYRDEMARPIQPVVVAPTVVAPAPQVIAPTTVAPTVVTNSVSIASSSAEVAELQKEFDKVAEQIALLTQVLEHQVSKNSGESKDARIAALEERIALFESTTAEISKKAESQYQTPIRPTNANLGTTALRASEIFPKVPYYIAGTEQIGEFWVEPRITDDGYLVYNFNFLDPDAELGKIVEKISMFPEEIELTVSALEKVNEWTNVAQERNIRRRHEQSAICFPATDCAEKKPGNTSTEVMFLIYEDGRTAGQFKRNKGRSSANFNISNESGMLLAAYLDYMLDVGSKEFEASTMTDEDLSEVFK